MTAVFDMLIGRDGPGLIRSVSVSSSPSQALRALTQVTVDEIELPRFLNALRRLVIRVRPNLGSEPVYAALLDAGFVALAAAPMQQLILGRIVSLGPLGAKRIRNELDFGRFRRMASVKVAVGLRLLPEEANVRIAGEIRLVPAGLTGGILSATVWPVLARIFAVGMEGYLSAVKRRLERGRDGRAG